MSLFFFSDDLLLLLSHLVLVVLLVRLELFFYSIASVADVILFFFAFGVICSFAQP